MRVRVVVAAALVMALSACTSPKPQPTAAPTTGTPTATASPSETADPTPSASPTPTASTSPSPKPSTTSPKPPTTSPKPPPPPAAGPIKCTGSVALNRPPANGTGPAGSILKTGSAGVALTFDDGPDPINTPKILDLLKQCGVKATFCLVGFRAKAHPALVQRIAAEGHTLCNHSWQHRFDIGKWTEPGIRSDLQMTIDAIHAAVPGAPVKYFRAPGGNFTDRLVAVASDMGMSSIYWHVDPRDWDNSKYGHGTAMVNHIISSVESNVRPGSIVLSHDNGKPDTITAYRTLLPWLKARFTLIGLPNDSPL